MAATNQTTGNASDTQIVKYFGVPTDEELQQKIDAVLDKWLLPGVPKDKYTLLAVNTVGLVSSRFIEYMRQWVRHEDEETQVEVYEMGVRNGMLPAVTELITIDKLVPFLDFLRSSDGQMEQHGILLARKFRKRVLEDKPAVELSYEVMLTLMVIDYNRRIREANRKGSCLSKEVKVELQQIEDEFDAVKFSCVSIGSLSWLAKKDDVRVKVCLYIKKKMMKYEESGEIKVARTFSGYLKAVGVELPVSEPQPSALAGAVVEGSAGGESILEAVPQVKRHKAV